MYVERRSITESAPPPASVGQRFLGSRFLLVLNGLASVVVLKFAFVDVIAQSAVYRYSGAIAYTPISWSVPMGIIFALLPLAWLRISADKPSDLIVIYLYYLVYLPSCVLLPYVARMDFGQQFQSLVILLAAFGILETRRFSLTTSEVWALTRKDMFHHALIFVAVVITGILAYFGNISIQNIDFFGVYERRADLIGGSLPSILFYAANFAGFAVAPMLVVYGMRSRQWHYVLAALALACIAFAASSLRSHLFVTLLCALAYVGFALFPRRAAANFVGWGLVAVSFLVLLLDALINYEPLLTWAVQFRIIGNNGFLTAKYFEYFWYNPAAYYVDSFMRFFLESPYNRPIAQVVGESFTDVVGNHANGNLWADGFGNMKAIGVFVASMLVVLMSIGLDWLARGKDPKIVLPLMIAIAVALANTSLTTALSSNGIVLLLLLLALLPLEQGNGGYGRARESST